MRVRALFLGSAFVLALVLIALFLPLRAQSEPEVVLLKGEEAIARYATEQGISMAEAVARIEAARLAAPKLAPTPGGRAEPTPTPDGLLGVS